MDIGDFAVGLLSGVIQLFDSTLARHGEMTRTNQILATSRVSELHNSQHSVRDNGSLSSSNFGRASAGNMSISGADKSK